MQKTTHIRRYFSYPYKVMTGLTQEGETQLTKENTPYNSIYVNKTMEEIHFLLQGEDIDCDGTHLACKA